MLNIAHGLVGGAVLWCIEGVGGVGTEGDGVDGVLGGEDVRLRGVGTDDMQLGTEGELSGREGSAQSQYEHPRRQQGCAPVPRPDAQEGGEETVKGHQQTGEEEIAAVEGEAVLRQAVACGHPEEHHQRQGDEAEPAEVPLQGLA